MRKRWVKPGFFRLFHQSQHRAGQARTQPEQQWGSGAEGGVVSYGASALGALGVSFPIKFFIW